MRTAYASRGSAVRPGDVLGASPLPGAALMGLESRVAVVTGTHPGPECR